MGRQALALLPRAVMRCKGIRMVVNVDMVKCFDEMKHDTMRDSLSTHTSPRHIDQMMGDAVQLRG